MGGIATLTVNPALDTSMTVGRVEPDMKNRCSRPARDPGGGGINVARAIMELGGEATAVFPCGGHTGEEITDRLREDGLEFRCVWMDTSTRENITIVEREGGRQFRFNTPGVELGPGTIGRCREAVLGRVESGGIVVLSGSLPPGVGAGVYGEIIDTARERGMRTVLDTSGEALKAGVRAGPDLIKPNARELGELVGREIVGLEDATEAAAHLVEDVGVGTVVVSLSTFGASLVTKSERLTARNPDVEAVSSIGAGDSMVAAITLALSRGLGAERMLADAVAAGCAAVMTPGTQLLRRSDYERLRSEIDVRTSAAAG